MCIAEQRDRVQRAARDLDQRKGVLIVDDHPPWGGKHPKWSIDAILESGGIPSVVLTILGQNGLELREDYQVGAHWRFVAVSE